MAEELKRLQTFIPAETLRKAKIVAAECGTTIAQTVDWLLTLGIKSYVEGKSDGNE